MAERENQKIGRYGVKEVIGRGSMGVVYLAYDPVLDREVAVKTIETQLESEREELEIFIERFKREAKAAAKLSHPGIIIIYDFGFVNDTTPYIVMEYVKGKTLKRYFEEKIRFGVDVIKDIIIQIAKALDYAHKAGIVHRDIKPANIIIQDDFSIKIADFGIARLPHSELTKTGEILGTPNYMSPEQITGIPADYRADIFSVGVIMYQLLTGDKPFVGDSFGSLSYRIVHEQPLSPKVLNPSIPDSYSEITMALLEKDRNKRPSLDKLISVLEETPIDKVETNLILEEKDLHQLTTKEIGLKELSLLDSGILFFKRNIKALISLLFVLIIVVILVYISNGSRDNTLLSKSVSPSNNTFLEGTKQDESIKQLGSGSEVEKEDDKEGVIVDKLQAEKESIISREKTKEAKPIIIISNVKHIHTVGSCSGSLIFYDNEVEYKTRGKDYRSWRYDKLRGYEMDGLFLIIKTYERQDYDIIKIANRNFKFSLPNYELSKEVFVLLKEKINKIKKGDVLYGT